MPTLPQFNYIVTIHNKQELLARTLAGVAKSCSRNAQILPVLDGCTDRSEEIVNAFMAESGLRVRKLYTPDVHEIRSINAALSQITEGFTIVLQDDVVLDEPDLERKIFDLYQRIGPLLGVVSLRLAANVRRMTLVEQMRSRTMTIEIRDCDLLLRPDDYLTKRHRGKFDEFYERMLAIKGPICIPESVFREVGRLDEQLAPFCYDDVDYSIRTLKAGFINGLFPLKFKSEPEWGGTRQDPSFPAKAAPILRRNRRYLWQKHGEFLTRFWRTERVNRGREAYSQARAA